MLRKLVCQGVNERGNWMERNMSGLWTFGRPYKSGVLPAELYNLEYSCEEIAPDLFRDLNRSFISYLVHMSETIFNCCNYLMRHRDVSGCYS